MPTRRIMPQTLQCIARVHVFIVVGVHPCSCNYDSAVINANASGVYTTGSMRECIIGDSPPGLDCSEVTGHCWIIPVATSPVLFRCMPTYGVNNTAASTCVYPEGVASSDDPVRGTLMSHKHTVFAIMIDG